jgi:hypothetical protein
MRHLVFAGIIFFSVSCGTTTTPERESEHEHVDSTEKAVDSSYSRTIATDSGRIIVAHHAFDDLETATIYDRGGYIIYKGSMLNGERTGAWLKYDREGKVIAAWQYSNGNIIHSLDASDFETKPLHLHQLGIGMKVPAKWFVPESKNPWALLTIEKKSDSTVFNPSINISRGELESGETLDQLADKKLKQMHSSVGRVETIDTVYFNIDGNCGFKRYGMYSNPVGQTGFLDAIIVHGRTSYVISCTAPNTYAGEFLKYQAVFEAAIESIHFEE